MRGGRREEGGTEAVCLLHDGYQNGSSTRNHIEVPHLLALAESKVLRGDVRRPKRLRRTLEGSGVTYHSCNA